VAAAGQGRAAAAAAAANLPPWWRRTRQGGPRGLGRTPQPKLRCKATRARLGTFPYVSLEYAAAGLYICVT
jgi:hypothetical protein